MFYLLNNTPLIANEIDVLTELKNQLAINGIYRFNEFRTTTNHIQFNCPIHNNGQERKPSCGITTNKIIHDNNRFTKSGLVHCFACGYTATLQEMISTLFGHDNDLGLFGDEWLKKNFSTVTLENRKNPLADFKFKDLSNTNINNDKINYISEEELDSYRYIHPYMYKRKLTDEIIELFDIGYDANFKLKSTDNYTIPCITFPIHDINGNVLFIARRSVKSKFFHYPSNVSKPVYGLYQLKQVYNNYNEEIIICESMLNALTCWVYGKPAVALNGTGTPYQYEQLSKLNCRKFILGLDPDKAGDRGRKKLREYFKNKKLIYDYIIPTGKDINDLSKKEFDNLPIKSIF